MHARIGCPSANHRTPTTKQGDPMLRRPLFTIALVLCCVVPLLAGTRLPPNTILVPGATPGASDSRTPLPEGGTIAGNAFRNPYFGLSYPLPAGWIEKRKGPPPTDSGAYVLTLLSPSDGGKSGSNGSVLVTAQDLFFSLATAGDALETMRLTRRNLQPYYTVEHEPAAVTIGGRPFARFGYQSPVAGLHWQVLATTVRCHVVQFVMMSRDTALVDKLAGELETAKLTAAPDDPVCIQNYATSANILAKVDPVLEERRFNPVPVRIIIDREGKVRHVHVISGYPEQIQKITYALSKWRFKPYLKDGQPAEIETGLMFGNAPPRPHAPGASPPPVAAAQ